jgi:hypothetical protein
MTQKNRQIQLDNPPAKEELLSILESLISAAEKDDVDSVKRLSKRYASVDFTMPMSQRPADYDGCRQSCVFAVTTFRDRRAQYLADAKYRFARLS